MIDELRKLKGNEFLVGLVAFLAVVAPGFLTIYHYHPELVKELDAVKLLLFSASLSCPVILGNMLFLVAGNARYNVVPEKGQTLLLACFCSVPSFYGALLSAWYFHFPFSAMIKFFIVLFLGMGFALISDKSKIKAPPLAKTD